MIAGYLLCPLVAAVEGGASHDTGLVQIAVIAKPHVLVREFTGRCVLRYNQGGKWHEEQMPPEPIPTSFHTRGRTLGGGLISCHSLLPRCSHKRGHGALLQLPRLFPSDPCSSHDYLSCIIGSITHGGSARRPARPIRAQGRPPSGHRKTL